MIPQNKPVSLAKALNKKLKSLKTCRNPKLRHGQKDTDISLKYLLFSEVVKLYNLKLFSTFLQYFLFFYSSVKL